MRVLVALVGVEFCCLEQISIPWSSRAENVSVDEMVEMLHILANALPLLKRKPRKSISGRKLSTYEGIRKELSGGWGVWGGLDG